MRLILPFLSLVVLLLTGETLARPSFVQKRGHNSTLAAIIAKRQTNRNQINVRAHVKETVKRVRTQLAVEREEVIAERSTTTTVISEERDIEAVPLVTRANVYARQGQADPSAGPLRKRALPAPPTRANLYARQGQADPSNGPLRKRALPAPPTRANLYARQGQADPSAGPLRKRALPGSNEKRRQQETEQVQRVYPKCEKTSARTGYAHYPGWKLVGDELSGALPVKPESACIQACNRYGGACSGVFFDNAHGKCYLKGTKTSEWDFTVGANADGVDLVGGCDLWSNIVPEEMDAICCRD